VIQELLPEYQLDLSAMRLLYIRSQQGTLVPLTSVATMTPGLGPLTVNHSGQLPSVTLSFNLAPNVALGAGVSEVQRAAGQILPSTISTGFSGTAQAFQASQQGLLFLLLPRGRRDLHRPGDPLRELHSPAHDSVGAPVRGLRRAADAACCSARS